MDVRGKKIVVIGLGNSGVNAALLLKDNGAEVLATDISPSPEVLKAAAGLRKKGITVETGTHTEDMFKGCELAVVSPGVEDASDALKWATRHSVPVIGEMELGFSFCKGKIIAITGTNGKSTVTTLVGEILKHAGKDAVVCGNIGNSLCGEISKIGRLTWVVMEVSSFQLERIREFKPHIAVILNITDDHMDRYTKFSDYFNEKLKIFSNQDEGDLLILNYDAGNLRALEGRARSRVLFYSAVKEASGAFVKEGSIFCVRDVVARRVCRTEEIGLKGVHNLENALSAALLGSLAGADEADIATALRGFKGLPHRVEALGVIDDVEYINDSKGTTVDSTRRALESSARPVILIAGGKDKHSDYAAARDAVRDKVRHLVLIGEAKGAIKKAIGDLAPVHEAPDMCSAVETAHCLAERGDVVLLSPMCSSFDMFRNYEERGEAFRVAVDEIRKRAMGGKVL